MNLYVCGVAVRCPSRSSRAIYTITMTTLDAHTYKVENARPFVCSRMVKPGYSITGVPSVVKCVWTTIKTENLLVFDGELEDARGTKSCNMHKGCRGHLCIANGTYLIPYGFAAGGEIIASEASMLNQSVILGDKNSDDVAAHCYKRIATKNGILRKLCNGCRPTNSMRLVASPGNVDKGVIQIPHRVMNRSRFVYVSQDGRCKTRKLKDGDTIVMGRCPSQGSDSALPMRVSTSTENTNSVRVPLEVCKMNNADFDGDELWMLVPMSTIGFEETRRAWYRVWGDDRIISVFGAACALACENGLERVLDPATLTTMTFEEMSQHPGGRMYDSMMLKPKSWREMYKVMVSVTYWRSHVSRSETGIMNTVMSRHGIAGPYGSMRMGMMLGTCVNTRGNVLVVDSVMMPVLPRVVMTRLESSVVCSSAMTKLTKVMYQAGIDMSKHGAARGKIPAIRTILTSSANTYAIAGQQGNENVVLIPSADASRLSNIYTNMNSIRSAAASPDVMRVACGVVALVEELDSVELTNQERVAAAFLLVFLSAYTNEVVGTNTVELMGTLGLDWYTSVTCSDVRWIKNVMRNAYSSTPVSLTTDVSSILGSIFIGNMSMFTSADSTVRGCMTVNTISDGN